jgi:hypothetical protein
MDMRTISLKMFGLLSAVLLIVACEKHHGRAEDVATRETEKRSEITAAWEADLGLRMEPKWLRVDAWCEAKLGRLNLDGESHAGRAALLAMEAKDAEARGKKLDEQWESRIRTIRKVDSERADAWLEVRFLQDEILTELIDAKIDEDEGREESARKRIEECVGPEPMPKPDWVHDPFAE